MPPRKKTANLEIGDATIAQPVPKEIVDTNTASVGIPPQADYRSEEEIGALRKQIEHLRTQIDQAAATVRSGVRQAARQTEATVKLYPVSSLLAVGAVAAVLAFAIAGRRSQPQRSRYDRSIDELQAFYERFRDRF